LEKKMWRGPSSILCSRWLSSEIRVCEKRLSAGEKGPAFTKNLQATSSQLPPRGAREQPSGIGGVCPVPPRSGKAVPAERNSGGRPSDWNSFVRSPYQEEKRRFSQHRSGSFKIKRESGLSEKAKPDWTKRGTSHAVGAGVDYNT